MDFSPPIAYGSLGIFSSLATGSNKNDLVSDAFDAPSYIAILLAWIGIVCIMRASVYKNTVQAILNTFGSSFNQVIYTS